MKHLRRTQIIKLREFGYPLAGENWLTTTRHDFAEGGLTVVKVVNGDTLATVFVPADILTATEMTFS